MDPKKSLKTNMSRDPDAFFNLSTSVNFNMSTSVKDSNATHHEQYVGGGENEPKLPTRRGLQLGELGLRAIIGED